MLDEFKSLRLEKLYNEMSDASRALISIHDNASLANEVSRSLYARATVNSFSLAKVGMQLVKTQLGDALFYFNKHSKFLYVLLRVFRVLVSKGFCSDDVSEGGDGNGNGDANDMKFEDDVEGTGMGEGGGKNDVTDELENEEQLLGLKGDDNKEAPSQERKELKEDEVDTGMEMEADFEGEKYDLPDNPDEQKDENNSDNEEELDRVSLSSKSVVLCLVLLDIYSSHCSQLGNGQR
jgi:midasin (ATPase involved in ribosome maturation)